ncbi:MAG: hypothetical protein ACI3W5_04090 [Faecousia sp.]
MNIIMDYNIQGYVDSIIGGKQMILDGILNPYKKCKKYLLNSSVSEYLRYIDEEPFYIPPSFSDVKTNIKMSTLKPKFVLLSAPGATGKSSLAKHISYRFDALYWNLAKVKIGTNSFAGSILNAVGATKYSEFIGDLNTGDVLLVIDAFDEAEIVSGRKMLNSFIADISDSLASHQLPTVFMLARTETAQYIASFCAENGIPVSHYEIGFFNEDAAKNFIVKSVVGKKTPTKPDLECADSYYDVIKRNITADECTSFLGYAPVLEAISAHIKESPNRQKMISELSTQKDCVSIIMKIMGDLLIREQTEKVAPAFSGKCMASHPEFTEWEKVYSAEEQLVRVIYYVLFRDTAYGNYPLDFLPPQLVDDYQAVLDSFLPQHPFVRNSAETTIIGRDVDFTGPAFRDYSLAKIILNENYEALADMYFEESQSQSYFPSQIFFDCYTKIANNIIQPNHISYVYDSYKAKATAYERPYLQCSEIPTVTTENANCIAVFGMIAGKQQTPKRDDHFAEIPVADCPLQFEQLVNVSIDAPNMTVAIGRKGLDARIYNSSVVCKKIDWTTRNIVIESFDPEGCLLVAREGFSGDSVMIDITRADSLKVCAPNLTAYYKLIPYYYDFEDTSGFDIIKFIHALRCILVEFRTHRKDTLAKTAERIEFVTVGNSAIKRQVLEYLKHCGIIYTSDHLYKIDEAKLQEKGIFFNALSRMDTQQMNGAFLDFCRWAQK